MSEESERAAFYEDHKDDPEIWDEAKVAPTPHLPKRLAMTVTVRFSAEEAERIRRIAKATGLTYAEVVRSAVAQASGARSAARA